MTTGTTATILPSSSLYKLAFITMKNNLQTLKTPNSDFRAENGAEPLADSGFEGEDAETDFDERM